MKIHSYILPVVAIGSLALISCVPNTMKGANPAAVQSTANSGYATYPQAPTQPATTYSTPTYTQPTYTPPAAPAVPTAPAPSAAATHTVIKGDTLFGISRKYGTSVDALRSMNSISGDLIRPGQSLRVR